MGSLAAFIMAGGKSSRFGSDKCLYVYDGATLIARAVETAFRITDEVAVVTNTPDAYPFLTVPRYPDSIPGLGPIGGILTALERTTADRVLVLACDMPLLEPALLRYMAGLTGDFDMVIPVVRGWIEPLHAIYGRACLPAVRAAIDRGQRQVRSIMQDLRVREVAEDEIRRFGDPDRLFKNINYLHDALDASAPGAGPASSAAPPAAVTRSEPMHNHRIMLDRKADEALAGEVFTEELLSFYRQLFDYQAAQHERYAAWPERADCLAGPPAQGHGLVLKGAAQGFVAAGVHDLAVLTKRFHPGVPFDTLAARLADDGAFLDAVVGAALGRDFGALELLAAEARMGFEEMIFLVMNWLKPLVIVLREDHAATIGAGEPGKDCPFCGWPPDLALLVTEKEGRRFLHCTFCEHRWPYARLACAVCGNDDPTSLGYLGGEGADRLRIDYCDRCGGYIKTIRLAKFEGDDDVDPVVENILTAALDSRALREGYRRP